MDFENLLTETNFHQLTLKHCPQIDQRTSLLLSSSLSLLTHVANADKDISSHEIAYLKYFLKHEFDLKPEVYRSLVKAYYFIYTKEKPSNNQILACKAYLKNNLSADEKKVFLDTLLCLSVTDQDMSSAEKVFINNIAMALDLEKQDVQSSILSKSLELIQAIDLEIAKDENLVSDISELGEITFASAHEFMDSLK